MERFRAVEETYSSLPKHDFLQGDTLLYQYKGFWFFPFMLSGLENVIRNYKPLPNDVILASFPKTGTTWLKSLLFAILHRSSSSSSSYLTEIHPHELVPTLELQVYDDKQQEANHHQPKTTSSFPNKRRIFSTHISHQLIGGNLDSSDCRVVYLTRDPKDAVASLFHFMNTMRGRYFGKEEPWPLEEFVDSFCKGTVHYGPYYNHVLGYKKESLNKPNKVFFITYEELKNDTNNVVKRLADFLGCPIDDEEELEEIVKSCSIETLTSHQVNKSSEVPSWSRMPYSAYFRKGEVGDYENYMTKEMIDLVDATTLEKFGGLSYDEFTKLGAAAGGGN